MATNPNYPPRRDNRGPEIVGRREQEKIEGRSGFPWPLIALIVAGVILVAIIYALPRTPKNVAGPTAGQVPDQPFGDQIQLSGLRVADSPVGGQVYVYGLMQNTGSNPIGQVTVNANFTDKSGQPLQQETRNVEFLKSDSAAPEVMTTPLKPRETTPFRVGFDGIQANWDHQVPRMQIEHVAAPGQGIPAGEPR